MIFLFDEMENITVYSEIRAYLLDTFEAELANEIMDAAEDLRRQYGEDAEIGISISEDGYTIYLAEDV
jgi:hypothetical protein